MRNIALFALSLCLATAARAEDDFRWVAQPKFQDAGAAYQGVVPLLQGGLWGLMGLDGAWAVPPQFEAIGRPGLGAYPVQKGGKWGLIYLDGEVVFDFEYEAIGTPAPYIPMKFQGQWYAFNSKGSWDETPLPFDTLIGNEGNCMVGTANGAPWLAYRGEAAKDQAVTADKIFRPAEGHVGFTLQDKAGHFECPYGTVNGGEADLDEVRPYAEGFAAARKGEGWGYVGIYDTYFEIGGEFEAAREFSEGLAPVKSGGLWGYIDRTGEFVIPPQFDQAYSFSDGIAGVQKGDKRGFVLPDGSFAATPQFDDFWSHDGGLAPVKVGDLWGVIAPEATDPAKRWALPLPDLAAAQAGRTLDFTLQPSNPHYYFFQDVASVHSISFAPDSTVMLTTLALQDAAEIALWDMQSQRLIRKIALPEATQAVLLPGRQIIAAGLATGHILLLDAVTGAELHRIRPHKNAVIDLVVSPDGKHLASADFGMLQIWSLETGETSARTEMLAHKLRFAADSQSLYAGTRRGALSQVSLTGEVLASQPEGDPIEYGDGPQSDAVSELALSANGSLFSLKTRSEQQPDGSYKTLSSVEVTTLQGRRSLDLDANTRDILTIDTNADGSQLAYSGTPSEGDWVASTFVIDTETGASLYGQSIDQSEAAREAGFDARLNSVDRLGFTPQGKLIIVGMEGYGIYQLDTEQKKVTASFGDRLTPVQSKAGLIGSDLLFDSDGSGNLWVWDLGQGQLDRVLTLAETGGGVEEGIAVEGNRIYLYSDLEGITFAGLDMATGEPVLIPEEEQLTFLEGRDYSDRVRYDEVIEADLQKFPDRDYSVVLAEGRLAVNSQPVGLQQVHDVASGELLAQFLATPDGEWLVLTPEGFFAASANGARLVSVSNGLRAFAVDQAYQALYRPDLVQAKLAGDPDGLVAKAAAELDLARIMGSGPAPQTRFSLPRDGSMAVDPEIEVQIELQDEGGGIGRVEWRLNGVTVEVQPTREAVALEDDAPKAVARMALDPGENVIEVVAYNAAGLLASAPQRLLVNWDGVASSEPPALHVLAVGVNDYADGRLQLKYAAADAQAFGAAMQKAGAGLFKSVDVVTLLDADVTEAKLDEAFAAMGARAKPQDVFVFFLAGHGKTIEGKYYFIPQDFRFDGDDPIRAGGIDQDRWQEWAARIKAKKSVLIYDTCESGSLTGSRSVDAAMAQSAAVQRLTRAMGRTILSASTDDAPALEGYRGHGVMTWAMLDAFGQADTNGNATIEVTELASFLDVKVPEVSAAAFGFRQVPQMSIKGSDFALGAQVTVLGDAPETFPATLTHVVAGGTEVLDAPNGAAVQVIESGVFYGVFKVEEKDGFARIAKDGKALGWVVASALTPLQ